MFFKSVLQEDKDVEGSHEKKPSEKHQSMGKRYIKAGYWFGSNNSDSRR